MCGRIDALRKSADDDETHARQMLREFESAVYPKGGYRFTYHAGLGDPGSEPELKFYWIPIEFLF